MKYLIRLSVVLILAAFAMPQNSDNGGILPITPKYINVDGVGAIEYYQIAGTYHGLPVAADVVFIGGSESAPLVFFEYSGLIGPLPLVALDKLDGGSLPQTAGTSGCWESPAGEVYPMTFNGSGSSLSAAVADYKKILAAEITAGWEQVPCP